ncbi:MAG: hypothetical protein WC562_03310 [Dehalococcoidia bacterium]
MDKCWYNGPCLLDDNALMKSGPLPAEFLRCCNVSEEAKQPGKTDSFKIRLEQPETLDRPIF